MEQLGEQPALADSGDADERHELRRSLADRPLESCGEQLDLAVAADERRSRTARHIDAETRARLERLPRGDRFRLPFRHDGLDYPVRNRPFRGSERLLADEDAVDRGRRLQPRGSVDDVAGRHAFALPRPRSECHERFARVYADPDVEVGLVRCPVAHG